MAGPQNQYQMRQQDACRRLRSGSQLRTGTSERSWTERRRTEAGGEPGDAGVVSRLGSVAALACVRLLRASNHPEPSVKNGYRWLAVAAVCLAAGAAVQQAFGGLIGGALPLRLADLISLGALARPRDRPRDAHLGPARGRARSAGCSRLLREPGGAVPAATHAGDRRRQLPAGRRPVR